MADLGGPYDAVVIGSGASGLCAANILAREGMKVLLLEQHYVFGGYLQRFWIDGTPFDTGCHYVGALGEGQVFDRYLRYLGVRDDVVLHALDPDGFDEFHYPDFSFAVPVGLDRFAARLCERFPAERDGVLRYAEAIRQEVARFPMYTLRDGAPSDASPSDRTLGEVVDSLVHDRRVREILCAYNMLYLVPPEEAPFTLHAFVVDSYLQGAYTIDGGGHALARALVRRLRERGGVALRRRRVTAIDVVDQQVRGVRTDRGEFEECRLVIACIDPKVAVSLLPPDAVRPVFRHRIERLRPGIGGVAAYLRTSADLSPYGRRNYFHFGEDGNAGVFSEAWLRDGTPPPVWLTAHSPRESRWRGPHAMTVLAGLRAEHFAAWNATGTGERGPDYDAFKRRLGDRLVEQAIRCWPELHGRVEHAEFATPLTHRDYTLNDGGAMYGTHHSIDQIGPRGASRRTRVRGLLLGGHSTLYPGLLGATISAFYACGEVVGLDSLHRRVVAA